jgi:hypothetical protein
VVDRAGARGHGAAAAGRSEGKLNPQFGRYLVLAGAALVVLGLAVWAGGLRWFGRLPGDIRIERESMRVYVPLVSMLLVSAALSVIAYIVRRWF